MARALRLNDGDSPDSLDPENNWLDVSVQEAKIRLMWAIHAMEAWVGSGLDEVIVLNEARSDMRIPVPCSEHDFVFQIARHSQTDSVDLQAHFTRLAQIQIQAQRYAAKHSNLPEQPLVQDTELEMLELSLTLWFENLPRTLQLTQAAIFMRKESGQLGGLLLLHIAYHNTMIQLSRETRYPHAISIAEIFGEALKHGPEALADTWLPVAAYRSARIILENSPAHGDASSTLRPLLAALDTMRASHSSANTLVSPQFSVSQQGELTIPKTSTS